MAEPVTGELLHPGETARLFSVDRRTLARWATEGKIKVVLTLGGHRRYDAEDVRRLLERRR